MRPLLIQAFAAAMLLGALPPSGAHAATGGEPTVPAQVDVAPCLNAAGVDDDDKVDASCADVIDNEKTAKADRYKALVARGAHFARRGFTDRAI
jgi:hypothetical protein